MSLARAPRARTEASNRAVLPVGGGRPLGRPELRIFAFRTLSFSLARLNFALAELPAVDDPNDLSKHLEQLREHLLQALADWTERIESLELGRPSPAREHFLSKLLETGRLLAMADIRLESLGQAPVVSASLLASVYTTRGVIHQLGSALDDLFRRLD